MTWTDAWSKWSVFCLSAELPTIQPTDRYTDRTIRLCTNAVLDGPSSMERLAACIVSVYSASPQLKVCSVTLCVRWSVTHLLLSGDEILLQAARVILTSVFIELVPFQCSWCGLSCFKWRSFLPKMCGLLRCVTLNVNQCSNKKYKLVAISDIVYI